MPLRRVASDVLARFAFAIEILEGPTPRARTYGAASRTVFQLDGDLAELRASGKLDKVRGLGPTCLAVIDEVIAGREPEELKALEAKIPPGLFEIRKIKGLGPAKIRALHEGLGIATPGELEHACKENRLVTLPGFGDKTQAKVLEGVQALRRHSGKLLRDAALAVASEVTAALAGMRVSVVGDLATGEEVITAVALLVEGDADTESRARAIANELPLAKESPLTLTAIAATRFGVEEIARTSDGEHFAALRALAGERGLSLDAPDPRWASAGAVYETLGLVFVPPERRLGAVLPRIGQAPRELVALGDLKGALHNHTLASDGAATLAEMRAAAVALGLSYLGISEHSQSADYARGLSPERLRAQRDEIAAMNADGSPCTLLTGVESDILADGSLDYEGEVLALLEVVIASSHRRFSLDRARSTERMVRAAGHPRTDVLGHPTGRLLLARPPLEFDVDAVLDACVKNGCAVELNGSAHRLDFGARELAMAKERGIPVSIAADAHAVSELGEHLGYAISVARRAGLTPDDVLNARPLDALRAWLSARRAKA